MRAFRGNGIARATAKAARPIADVYLRGPGIEPLGRRRLVFDPELIAIDGGIGGLVRECRQCRLDLRRHEVIGGKCRHAIAQMLDQFGLRLRLCVEGEKLLAPAPDSAHWRSEPNNRCRPRSLNPSR